MWADLVHSAIPSMKIHSENGHKLPETKNPKPPVLDIVFKKEEHLLSQMYTHSLFLVHREGIAKSAASE